METQLFRDSTDGRTIEVGFAYTDYEYDRAYNTFAEAAKHTYNHKATYDCFCSSAEYWCPEFAGQGKFMDRALTAAEKQAFEQEIIKREFIDKGWTLVA